MQGGEKVQLANASLHQMLADADNVSRLPKKSKSGATQHTMSLQDLKVAVEGKGAFGVVWIRPSYHVDLRLLSYDCTLLLQQIILEQKLGVQSLMKCCSLYVLCFLMPFAERVHRFQPVLLQTCTA